jgi:hypothetical protein
MAVRTVATGGPIHPITRDPTGDAAQPCQNRHARA